MKWILGPRGLKKVAVLPRDRTLYAFDFDGTLAPLVASREAARIRRTTKQLLAKLAARAPCVVISGRARDDVARRLRGLPIRAIAGNHGAEPSPDMAALEAVIVRAKAALTPHVAVLEGVELEDKRLTLSIHYRCAPEPDRAKAAILRAAEGLPPGLHLIPGKRVVSVVPQGAPNKGDALRRLQQELGCTHALFVGDDDTDEDVFALEAPNLLAVRVRKSRTTHARWYLRTQRELDVLLTLLATRALDR
ncbi:trehalose-phosphatase [Myxococcota bacterium]|nr:trehalose-phosphatase [Myxococcota bacterium]